MKQYTWNDYQGQGKNSVWAPGRTVVGITMGDGGHDIAQVCTVFLYPFLFNNHSNTMVQRVPEPMCKMDHTEQTGGALLVCDTWNTYVNETLIHVKATLPSNWEGKLHCWQHKPWVWKVRSPWRSSRCILNGHPSGYEMTYMLALSGQKSKKMDKGKCKADPELEVNIANPSKGKHYALGHQEGKCCQSMCMNCTLHLTVSWAG